FRSVRRGALALQGRLLQRDQMLVHLALAEALERLLARPADMDDELRADLDLPPVAPGLLGLLAQGFYAGADAIDMHAGRQPAGGPLHRALDVVGMIAADIDRQLLLVRLGEELDVLEFVVSAIERG